MKIKLPEGIPSLAMYETVLRHSVTRLSEQLEAERAELKRVQTALAVKKTPVQVKAKNPLVLDSSKPLSTQVQAVAKHCGLVFSGVYSEKTKTKGRKVKLHMVYSGSFAGPVLSKAKFNAFEAELRKAMETSGVTINSVEFLAPPKGDWRKTPSIAVFFA
jgi:hypothetical protein